MHSSQPVKVHPRSGWSAPLFLSKIRDIYYPTLTSLIYLDPRVVTDVGEPSVGGPTTNPLPSSSRSEGPRSYRPIHRFISNVVILPTFASDIKCILMNLPQIFLGIVENFHMLTSVFVRGSNSLHKPKLYLNLLHHLNKASTITSYLE